MIDKRLFEEGRKELEALLNGEVSANREPQDKAVQFWYEDVKAEHTIISIAPDQLTPDLMRKWLMKRGDLAFIRTDAPFIVGFGTHQAVIELKNGLVAKVPHKNTDWVRDDYFRIHGAFPFMQRTYEELRDMGFSVPEIKLYRIDPDEERLIVHDEVKPDSRGNSLRRSEEIIKRIKGQNWLRNMYDSIKERLRRGRNERPNVYLTSDLREGGRYAVVEYDEEKADALINGKALIDDFQRGSQRLMSAYDAYCKLLEESGFEGLGKKSGKTVYFGFEPHKENDPEEAIRKMFALQVPEDEREEGKLVVGDFDHVYVFR